MPDLPPIGLPGEELQEDLLKNTKDDSDARGEKARRDPSQISVAALASVSPPGRASRTAIRVPGNRANPMMKAHQDGKGHPLPAARVDFLNQQRRREEGSGEEEDVEENPQGIHESTSGE